MDMNATKDGRLSSSHHFTPFGGDSDEEEPRDDYTVPQKVCYHSYWKRNQDAVYWVKKFEHKIKDCNSGRRSHMQSS